MKYDYLVFSGKKFMARIVFRRFCTLKVDKICLQQEFNIVKQCFGAQGFFGATHRVMVVHPKVRWGKHSTSLLTSPELQLNEAISLVNTLPYLRVTR